MRTSSVEEMTLRRHLPERDQSPTGLRLRLPIFEIDRLLRQRRCSLKEALCRSASCAITTTLLCPIRIGRPDAAKFRVVNICALCSSFVFTANRSPCAVRFTAARAVDGVGRSRFAFCAIVMYEVFFSNPFAYRSSLRVGEKKVDHKSRNRRWVV